MEASGQFHAKAVLPSWERAIDIHCIGGGVDPRASLVALEKRKICSLIK